MPTIFNKQKNPSQQKPPELDSDLIRQCREFLAIEVPSSNIVFVEEFSKYMPLFNKELYDQVDPKDIDTLAREYNSRFSLQHPIQILSPELDENGILHPGDRRKHKLDRTIPAMFRRVSTLNDLGRKVPALMNAFMNATSNTSGPYDPRKAQYAQQIAKAIALADKKDGKIDAQRAAFKQGADALVHDKAGGQPQSGKEGPSEESTTGMIEWD